MKEARVDLFKILGRVDWACITTNGEVRSDGTAVMGRGIALQAKTRWPGVAAVLANEIRQNGNVPNFIGYVDRYLRWSFSWPPPKDLKQTLLWSFPTKHHWKEPSDINLIVDSAKFLVIEATDFDDIEIAIPRPGCSNGGLSWDFVRPHLARVLDDRFTIIHNE